MTRGSSIRPAGPVSVAFGTLTVFPVHAAWDESAARRAVAFYPAVGWAVGAAAAAVPFVAAAAGWRGQAVGVVAVTMLVVAAGASRLMHLDALADTADGLLGGHTPRRRLEIMRDSSVGAFGAAAIALSVAGHVAALSAVLQATAWYAFVVAAVAARLGASVAMWTLPPARADGLAASAARRPRAVDVAVAAALAAALMLLTFVAVQDGTWHVTFSAIPLAGWPAHQIRGFVACVVAGAAAATILPRALARPIGGVTGDIAGASIELATLIALGAAALWG